MKHQYWTPDLGRVAAHALVGEDGVPAFALRRIPDPDVKCGGRTVLFAPDCRPPVGSRGLFVRVVGSENVETTRCFVPWRAYGKWCLGSGLCIHTDDTEEGWLMRFEGACCGSRVHVCWERQP